MAEKEVKKVKVRLAKAHTHAGKDYKAGDEIEVREDQARWLEESGAVQKTETKGKS
jgi:ribosomal 50S subunit-recycling heat shock protein